MKIQTKNKLAGIILVVCALTIVLATVFLKNYKSKSSSTAGNDLTPVSSSGVLSSASQTSINATATEKPDDSMIYKNTDYGFQVAFPASMKGYMVKKTQTDQAGVIAKYSVLLPTGDKSYKNLLDAKAIAIEFYIYDPAFWAKPEKEGVRSSEITKNEKYIYTYSIWEESPADLKTIPDKDFVNIIKTFKLTDS